MADKVDFGPRLGADPELFVIAKKGAQYNKNTIVPVCGLVGGTKDNPIPVPTEAVEPYAYIRDKKTKGFAYQEDNVMFEFNIPPTESSEIFNNYIAGYIAYLEREVIGPRGLMFSWNNKHKFADKLLQNPMAQTIGCSPDNCAYLPRQANERKPFDITELGSNRFCGGHLHVQYNYNNVPREVFARFMDLVVSLPFLKLDQQTERRQFYGKAGVFRPKEYGIEYRTPSNFWLDPKHRENGTTQKIASNIFALARHCNTSPDDIATLYSRIPWRDVEKAINTEDAKLGLEVYQYTQGYVPFALFGGYGAQVPSKKPSSGRAYVQIGGNR